jgi:hypothetical protein
MKISLEETIAQKKITTPYPHKYKTVMCRNFQKGLECPFGDECNYAHGK